MGEMYLVLLAGTLAGLGAAFLGVIIFHRNRLRTHMMFRDRLEAERTALQDDIAEMDKEELAETDAGKELMLVSRASIQQFGYARENATTSLKRHNYDLLKQIDEDRKRFAESEERLAALAALLQESDKRLENLRKENTELRLTNSLKTSPPSTDSAQTEKDLRITLEQVARMQNQLADASMRFVEAEAGSISAFSQELRETLSATLQYIDLLLDESVGTLNPTQRNFLETTKASTTRLRNVIEDFYQVRTSKAEFNALAHEPVDLNVIVDEALAETGREARAKRLTRNVHLLEKLAPVYADREALGQILIRILSNATAVSPLQGAIDVRVQIKTNEGKEYLLIEVSDTGGGIPAEDVGRVFAPSYRAEDVHARGVGDTGMGLFIAKTLTEAQNGRIWVDTEPGVGSTFNVLIPIARYGAVDGKTEE
jgi:signal transduction histidine kinase